MPRLTDHATSWLRSRLDLYHRLDVFHIRVPPLRERREDIMALATHVLSRFATRMRQPAARFAPETERLPLGLRLPGNVRELRNMPDHRQEDRRLRLA